MKKLLNIAILLAASTNFYAQKSWEFGLQAGAAAYQGETNPSYFALEAAKSITPQGGLLVRYNLDPQWSLEFNAHYGTLSGSDADADNEERRKRNLSFRTNLITAALQADYNLFGYQPYNMDQPVSPYVFAGVEYFNINPQAQYQGTWYNLQPLGTEGQGLPGREKKYSLHNIAIPVGAGMRVAVSEQWAVGLEFGIRKTFTDYIDDVGGTYMRTADLAKGNGPIAATLGNRTGEIGAFSDYRTGSVRGGKNDDDWYSFVNLSVSHLLYTNKPKGERGRGRTKFGCPKWLQRAGTGKKSKPKSSSRKRY
jgi:opacity protein-like surface antigen